MHGCKGMEKIIGALFLLFLAVNCITACVSEPKKTVNSLVSMVRARDIDGVKNRFDTAEINMKDAEGYSLLHIAVRQNDAQMTDYLLTLGADIEEPDPDGRTPLTAAAAENAFEAAQVLARYDARLFAADQDEVTAFQIFYDKKRTAAVLNSRTVLQKDETGKTPLHYAAEMLDQNLTAELLASAGDSVREMLEQQDDEGRTALEIVYAHPEEKAAAAIAASLLHAGAAPLQGSFAAFESATVRRNYSLRFTEGQTVLHLAAAAGHTGFVQFILDQGVPADLWNSANMTPLHEAVRNGQTAAAAALLEAAAQPDAEASLGNTALHFAVSAPHPRELVQLLLEKKANPSIKDEYGETPLHIAVRIGEHPDILRMLVQASAAADERNKKGETPLMLAVKRGLKEQAAVLIDMGANIHAEDTAGSTPFVETVRHHKELLTVILTPKNASKQDSKGRNALHLAVLLKTDAATAEYFIRQKTSVNGGDKAGNTPLHYAAANNRKNIGELLLANGSDIFITNKQGESPLKIALTKQDGRERWMITGSTVTAVGGNGDTPLHYAASWGMSSVIPYIISQGGNPNAKNNKGETPFFAAVKADNPQSVKALFDAKGTVPIDSFARDILGNTVLHAAIGWNAREAAEAVLRQIKTDAAALLNAKNTAGKTVLHIAAQRGELSFITLCLSYHADINSDDATGRTPLTEAIRYGKTAAALLLLKNNASPMRQDIQGRTALHEAVGTAPASVITALRKAGADPLARDSYGATPLSRSFRTGKNTLEAVLGNSSLLSNSDGETPLHIAVQEEVDEQLLRYLLSKKYALDKRDKTGSTALLQAVKRNSLPLCTVLLEAGADPFSADNGGESAALLALTQNTELLPLVIRFTGTKSDAAGNGIFHYAARYASAETMRMLLSETRDGLDEKNLAGETPAETAIRWQRTEIAEMLQAKRQ